MFKRLFFLVMMMVFSVPAFAVQPDEVLSDTTLEARAREISSQLRCLVCQNENIDDSSAPFARDLRLLVRERLISGDSNQQVITFLVERYGNYVLLKPPFKGSGIVLWALPFVFLGFAICIILVLALRRSHRNTPPLNAKEKEMLEYILKREKERDTPK